MPIVVLDSHPLSLISHPGNTEESLRCSKKIQSFVNNRILVVVPEIIDYELRRKLIHSKRDKSIEILNKLGDKGLVYAPITTEIMQKAADLWGWARSTGQSTANKDKIDIDVILAAQSLILAQETREYTVIATSNVSDLERYTPAKKLEDITIEYFTEMNRRNTSSVSLL